MTLLRKELHSFAVTFSQDLYRDFRWPANRPMMVKFLSDKNRTFKFPPTKKKSKKIYRVKTYSGYQIRRKDKDSNIPAKFPEFATEDYRSKKEHSNAVEKLCKTITPRTDKEDRSERVGMCDDIEAFAIVNNIIAYCRKDIPRVEIGEYVHSTNKNYRLNRFPAQKYRKV